MDKKKLITEEEKKLFRDEIKKIPVSVKNPEKSYLKKTQQKSPAPVDLELPPMSSHFQTREAEEIISFHRGGVRTLTLNQLKRGQLKIEALLDLHRMTLNSAYENLYHFIQLCRQKKIRCVNIVHGKGYHSKEGAPILKSAISEWLREHPDVLAYHTAKSKHGGSGALYVLLKTK